MKKITKIIIVSAAIILVGGVILLRLTGVLNWYSIPTSSMEPTLPAGNTLIFATVMENPVINDVVCYKVFNGEKTETYIKRLVAKEGDKLQIKNDLAYVNDKLIDDSTKLKFSYSVTGNWAIENKNLMGKEGDYFPMGENTFLCFLTIETAAKFKENCTVSRFETPKGGGNHLFMENQHPDWTSSNYGPITIPKGKCFVIGDNRDNSFDSRFKGYVDNADISGKVIGHFNL